MFGVQTPGWPLGELEPRDDDVTLELPINTLCRILKITAFSKFIHVVCEPGLPMRLKAPLGPQGSQVNIFLQHEGNPNKAPVHDSTARPR